MIFVRLYSQDGQRGPKIGLALRKSDVGARLLRSLQDPDLMRKGGFTVADLTRLDSGEMPLDKIARLYDGDEIETAISNRLEDLSGESEELTALRELLRSGNFIGTMGGERARTKWREMVSGARKSMDSDHDIKKFLPGLIAAAGGALAAGAAGAGMETLGSIIGAGSALGSAVGAGWEASGGAPQGAGPDQVQPPVQKGKGGQRAIVELTHRRHPGHTLRVRTTGEESWIHHQGAKEIAASERDASPAVCVAHLRHHLTRFHGI